MNPNQNQSEVQPKKMTSRASAWLVIFCLAIGSAVLAILIVLQPSKKNRPVADPNVSIRSTEEIQSWILAQMNASKAKVGVVNIWATWCEPCRVEMPELAKFEKTKLAPLLLISADNESDEALVQSFLLDSKVDFESSLIQGDQQVFIEKWQKISAKDPTKQWSMSLPATFLIDSQGQILSFSVGTTTALELTRQVETALDTMHD